MTDTLTKPPRTARAARAGRRRSRLTRRGWAALVILAAGVLVGGWFAALRFLDPVTVRLDGLDAGATLGAPALAEPITTLVVEPAERAGGARILLDDTPLDGLPAPQGGSVPIELGDLAEGEHTLAVELDRRGPLPLLRRSVDFTVDTTPPTAAVQAPTAPVPVGEPVDVRVRVDGAETVRIGGEDAAIAENGVASRTLPEPPDEAVRVVATDDVGNVTEQTVAVELALPGVENGPPIRAVHMSAAAWQADFLREPVLQMIDEGRINTVQLDLKDEAGIVGYESDVALAQEIGATGDFYDLPAVVDELHAKGVRVIGRLVLFRDNTFVDWATTNGRTELLVQTPGGAPYPKYGGFMNYASDEVLDYNLAIAREAADAGVDDILLDYVRRPDGDRDGQVVPGLEGEPEDAIVEVVRRAREVTDESGAKLGLSVYGISAGAPQDVSQDIPRMAQHAHYVAPMLYPSHWYGGGYYGVADPNAQPYEMIKRSVEDFNDKVAGTDAEVIPWLQDFDYPIPYTPDMVTAQIEGARDAGSDSFIMWDAACTYTTEVYKPQDA